MILGGFGDNSQGVSGRFWGPAPGAPPGSIRYVSGLMRSMVTPRSGSVRRSCLCCFSRDVALYCTNLAGRNRPKSTQNQPKNPPESAPKPTQNQPQNHPKISSETHPNQRQSPPISGPKPHQNQPQITPKSPQIPPPAPPVIRAGVGGCDRGPLRTPPHLGSPPFGPPHLGPPIWGPQTCSGRRGT